MYRSKTQRVTGEGQRRAEPCGEEALKDACRGLEGTELCSGANCQGKSAVPFHSSAILSGWERQGTDWAASLPGFTHRPSAM